MWQVVLNVITSAATCAMVVIRELLLDQSLDFGCFDRTPVWLDLGLLMGITWLCLVVARHVDIYTGST